MLKTPKPITFDPEVFESVAKSASQQTGAMVVPKSADPTNFPCFEVPINAKVLAYVPNHTKINADGVEDLLKDEGAFHGVRVGRPFYSKRCYSGIVNEAIGYDGSCPFCDAIAECWDLVNAEFAQLCLQKGVDIKDPADPLKEDRKGFMSDMAIKKASRYITFPIVTVETEPNSVKVKLNEDGTINYKKEWYTVSEKYYIDIWQKAFSVLTDADDNPLTHPGGHWFILDYTYTSKDGKYDKMTSAKELKVAHKEMKPEFAKIAETFDAETAEWTPLKATQTVIANFYLSLEDAKEIADEAMKSTRDKLQMFNACKVGASQNTQIEAGSAPAVSLENFGATQVENTPATGAPNVIGAGAPEVKVN